MKNFMKAEAYIRENDGLYRHYNVTGVIDSVERGANVALSRDEAIKLVQKIRGEKEMGPMAPWNI